MVELSGAYGQQITPVFDVDAYNDDIDVSLVIAKIMNYSLKKMYTMLTKSQENIRNME